MKIPLDEFLSLARKLDPKLKISPNGDSMSLRVILQGEIVGWIRISISNEGRASVDSVQVMDDMNISRNLEVTAATCCVEISRTNKEIHKAIELLY